MASTDNFDIYYPEQQDMAQSLTPHFGLLAQSVDDAMISNNQDLNVYIASLFESSSIRLGRTSNYSVPNPPETRRVVPFQTTSNLRGPNPPTVSSSRLNVQTAGLYLATFKTNVGGDNLNQTRSFGLMVNGDEEMAIPSIAENFARRTYFTLPLELQVGDQVYVETWAAAAGTGQFISSAATFQLTRIAPINLEP